MESTPTCCLSCLGRTRVEAAVFRRARDRGDSGRGLEIKTRQAKGGAVPEEYRGFDLPFRYFILVDAHKIKRICGMCEFLNRAACAFKAKKTPERSGGAHRSGPFAENETLILEARHVPPYVGIVATPKTYESRGYLKERKIEREARESFLRLIKSFEGTKNLFYMPSGPCSVSPLKTDHGRVAGRRSCWLLKKEKKPM